MNLLGSSLLVAFWPFYCGRRSAARNASADSALRAHGSRTFPEPLATLAGPFALVRLKTLRANISYRPVIKIYASDGAIVTEFPVQASARYRFTIRLTPPLAAVAARRGLSEKRWI
jgi:hypothetical protein